MYAILYRIPPIRVFVKQCELALAQEARRAPRGIRKAFWRLLQAFRAEYLMHLREGAFAILIRGQKTLGIMVRKGNQSKCVV